MKAIIDIKEIRSPISGRFQGFELCAAIPNLAAHTFGKRVPSFQAPYLIYRRGRYMNVPNEQQRSRFLNALKARGYVATNIQN